MRSETRRVRSHLSEELRERFRAAPVEGSSKVWPLVRGVRSGRAGPGKDAAKERLPASPSAKLRWFGARQAACGAKT